MMVPAWERSHKTCMRRCNEVGVFIVSREAGVRNLKKLLEKIYRKAALKLVKRGVDGPPKAAASDASSEQPAHSARCIVILQVASPRNNIVHSIEWSSLVQAHATLVLPLMSSYECQPLADLRTPHLTFDPSCRRRACACHAPTLTRPCA